VGGGGGGKRGRGKSSDGRFLGVVRRFNERIQEGIGEVKGRGGGDFGEIQKGGFIGEALGFEREILGILQGG